MKSIYSNAIFPLIYLPAQFAYMWELFLAQERNLRQTFNFHFITMQQSSNYDW